MYEGDIERSLELVNLLCVSQQGYDSLRHHRLL